MNRPPYHKITLQGGSLNGKTVLIRCPNNMAAINQVFRKNGETYVIQGVDNEENTAVAVVQASPRDIVTIELLYGPLDGEVLKRPHDSGIPVEYGGEIRVPSKTGEKRYRISSILRYEGKAYAEYIGPTETP